MSNKTYDLLKFIAQIFLPAVGTLYFTLAGIWGLPSAEEVVGTIVAVDTFLGVVLQISKQAYLSDPTRTDGTMNVGWNEETQSKVFSLNLNRNPEDLEHKEQITFRVDKPDG